MKPLLYILSCAALLLGLCACRTTTATPSPAESPSAVPVIASPQPAPEPSPEPSPSPTPEPDPIAQRIAEMSVEEQAGQLLLAGIQGTSAGEDAQFAIQECRVGGIILFRRNIESCGQTVALVNALHALNEGGVPLFIAADQEGGAVSRTPDEVASLPSAYAFGQTGDEEVCRRFGQALAAQCAAMGVNLDFAPVADVWSNPKNTVIGKRAFGSDADAVSRLMPQTMLGLSQAGVIPVVKHFPGHGDTLADSHYDLPVVNKTVDELEALELRPFRAALEAGAPAVMAAHLLVREVDDAIPSSLSPKVVDGLLRGALGFDGVVFTDDLTMGAISDTYGLGEAVVLAVEAGCDVLLVCHGQDNLQQARDALLDAVDSGRITPERLYESVYRILTLKADYGVTGDPVPAPDVDALNTLLAEARP